MQTMKDWHKSHPHLFAKSPRNLPGRDSYVDKFLFRWNRCRHMRHVFKRLLGIGIGLVPPPIAIKSISEPNCVTR